MNNDLMLAVFVKAMEEIVGDVPDDISLESDIKDLGVDSLSLVEMVMIIEDEFGLTTVPTDFESVKQVKDAMVVFARMLETSDVLA